ncbi:MAG: hypothetical protein MR869_00090, partial [Parabacteroides distasonis]|nr:hypothetical protein [Parabacteroides distasonis]
ISMRLLNRNNCLASKHASTQASTQARKQASKLPQNFYMYTPGRYAEDYHRIPARRVCARRMGKRPSYEYDTLSREW